MQRNGAGAVYLNVFHPDIINFLATKKENADEKVRIKTLSMGLVLPDKFYELVGNDDYMYLFSPYDVEREYGKPFSYINITEEYDNLVENKSITKSRIKARQLNDEISKLQQEAGYPYIINEDTVNLANAGAGKVIMSNLCLTGDTRINTDIGYRKLEDLHTTQDDFNVVVDNRAKNMDINDYGVSLTSSTKVVKTAEDADVYKLTTQKGREIKGTLWHKFYVVRNNELLKLPLSEVLIGDKLLTQSGESHSFGSGCHKELAFLVGSFIADGSITAERAHGRPSANISLYGDKESYITELETSIETVIGRYLSEDVTVRGSANTSPRFKKAVDGGVRLNSTLLARVFEMFGFHNQTKLTVPEFIFSSDKETQKEFLRGYLSFDGSFSTNNQNTTVFNITSTSTQLLRDVQMLLGNMGITPAISVVNEHKDTIKVNGESWTRNPSARIYVGAKEEVYKLSQLWEWKESHQAVIRNFVERYKLNNRTCKNTYLDTVTSIDFHSVEDVYDVNVSDGHSVIFNGIATGNCSEILQEHVPSKLNRDLSYSEVGQDISCNLGSTVISNMMDSGKEFGDKVELMMRALTKVSMSTSIEEVPTIKKGNDLTHSVGLGAMGLHSYLADMEIMYGDEQSKDFTNMYFLLLNYYSLKASNKLSKEAGNSYYGFENSTYASGEYFDTYLANNDLAPRTERVAELFEDIHIPTVEDWRQLQQEVQAFGLFNKYRMALAPYR